MTEIDLKKEWGICSAVSRVLSTWRSTNVVGDGPDGKNLYHHVVSLVEAEDGI
jgi:hypothetical protein